MASIVPFFAGFLKEGTTVGRMCGRFVLFADPEPIAGIDGFRMVGQPRPNWNTAPTHTIAIGRLMQPEGSSAGDSGSSGNSGSAGHTGSSSGASTRELVIGPARWGLVPHWAKPDEQGKPSGPVLFNARSETASSKPSFRSAVSADPHDPEAGRGRCVIPMNGWYEWVTPERSQEFESEIGHTFSKKQPFFTTLLPEPADPQDSLQAGKALCERPFYVAGLYSVWESVVTATILTRQASPGIQWLHDRMPVVLDDESARDWLDGGEPGVVPERVVDRLYSWPVGTSVGSVKNNDRELLEPIEL